MPKVIQNNNQTLSNNVNSNSKSGNYSSNSSTSSHSVLSSVFARLVSILSSFILVLRHGLKKIKEFLGLFPYLRTLFPWRSSTFIKRSRQIRIVAFISCFAFVLLSFTILHPLSSPTQPTEAATGSSQSSSLTLDLASSSASVDLLVTDPEGSFAVSSSNAEFNVTTNNFTGYTLSIMSSNDEGLLTSTNGNSLSSITSAISLDTFAGSSSYNGKWGYRPSVYNAAANTSFLPSPTTTATTLDTTTAPNTSTPNYYTIEIGVRSDYTTASSSYTNTFIITAVSNPINYTISYNSNTSDNVTNMPATQSSSTSATSIVLADNVPVRDGYDFMGWCTVAPDTTTPETCTGTTFQPGGDFGIDQTTLNNTTLYAMWKSQVPVPTGSIQDFTLQQCQYYANSSDYTLTDTRDNNTYTVRYINGNCWMTENLRLSGGRTLTSADSNVASSWSFPNTSLTSGHSYTDAYSTISSNDSYGGYYNYCAASAGTVCSQTKQDATYDICPKGWRLPTQSEFAGIVSYSSAFSPVYSGHYFDGSLNSTGSRGYWWSSTARDSYGQYYLLYNSGSLSTDVNFKYLGFSVRCVKGEPGTVTINFDGNGADGGSTASQQIAAGNTTNLNANGFTRTNYVFTGWNTAADGSGISYSDQASYTVTPATGDATVTLYAQWLQDVGYMQNFTVSQCQSQASSQPVIATDIRDNNTYTLRYINGNCWMTQNLRLSGGRTLTSADSNVASSWSFPSTSLTSGNNYTDARYAVDSTYGGYYNYCAASAGTVCDDTTKQDTTYDICPKGWRLPTRSEFTGITSYSSAFSPVYSGVYSNSTLNYADSYGYWWSSIANFNSSRFILRYNGGSLSANFSGDKDTGNSVRCIKGEPGTLTINFDGNGATGGSTASQQIAAGNTANLNTNGFTRTNYAFTGWNTAADGSGVSYSDQASYTVTPATGDATVTLYAQWLKNVGYMQNFTLTQCRSQASSQPVIATDIRDNNTYTLRYINGNCWMTQNLRLSGGRTLTSADSNVASSWSFPSTELAGNSYSYTDPQSTISSNTSYGGYYNFCAASAGTACSETGQDATYDICPKGWRLPTRNEFTGITSYSSAFSPVYSGRYNRGSLSSTGSVGYFWSSTASHSGSQYILYCDSSFLNTSNSYKYRGLSVRCVRSS